jgi:AAA15 family ATPase/GTPase
MIQSFSIRNFRCFKNLKATSLKRFNIIVGESGSGKTTLLEALFLLGGASPEIYFRLRNWRGFANQVNVSGTKESYESLFRDMFHDFDQSLGASIESYDSTAGSRQVEIAYKGKDEYSLDLSLKESNAFLIQPMLFRWTVAGKIHNSSLELRDGKFVIEGSAPVAPRVYLNPVNTSAQQNTSSFSALNRKFKTSKLVDAVSSIFPQVREISLEVVAGETVLHVATNLPERLPIGDLSGGINKFVSIALGILANPGGVVIVDEIEGGFYYRNMTEIWTALLKLCTDLDVQLIVSTHSYEFLKAAAEVFRDEAFSKSLQFMRLEKNEDGEHCVRKIGAGAFDSAISHDFEVR